MENDKCELSVTFLAGDLIILWRCTLEWDPGLLSSEFSQEAERRTRSDGYQTVLTDSGGNRRPRIGSGDFFRQRRTPCSTEMDGGVHMCQIRDMSKQRLRSADSCLPKGYTVS